MFNIGWLSLERFPRSFIAALVPLMLWGLLWAGVPGEEGSIPGLFPPHSPRRFLLGISALLPLVAGGLAIAILISRASLDFSFKRLLLTPLGFITIYGIVGIVSSFLAPDKSVALYWALVYLSVPAVLWVYARGISDVENLRRLINANWLLILLVLGLLFTLALLYLQLGKIILDPSQWATCRHYAVIGKVSWFSLSDGVLRPTGVGRYAALAGIIAVAGIWQKGQRSVWAVILFASLVLLIASGARTAIMGFAVAAPLVYALQGGKKAVLAGAAVVLVLLGLFLATGHIQTFMEVCMLRGVTANVVPAENSSPTPVLAAEALPIPPASEPPAGPTVGSPSGSQAGSPSSEPPAAGSTVGSPSGSQGPTTAVRTPPANRGTGAETATRPNAASEPAYLLEQYLAFIPKGFLTFTGRTGVWADGWQLFKGSPILGRGFHADRQVLNTHMHNAVLHAMVQSGILGLIPFLVAMIFGWVLLIRVIRNLDRLPQSHKLLAIQTAGILTFLTVRAFPESTGAFFSVDWLLLAPLLVYLQVAGQMVSSETGTK